jgi:hypothetical protein
MRNCDRADSNTGCTNIRRRDPDCRRPGEDQVRVIDFRSSAHAALNHVMS